MEPIINFTNRGSDQASMCEVNNREQRINAVSRTAQNMVDVIKLFSDAKLKEL